MRLFHSGWGLSSRKEAERKADPEVASASIEGAAPAPAAVVESEQEYSCESIFRRKSEVNTRSNSSNSERLDGEASRRSSSCELSQLASSTRCFSPYFASHPHEHKYEESETQQSTSAWPSSAVSTVQSESEGASSASVVTSSSSFSFPSLFHQCSCCSGNCERHSPVQTAAASVEAVSCISSRRHQQQQEEEEKLSSGGSGGSRQVSSKHHLTISHLSIGSLVPSRRTHSNATRDLSVIMESCNKEDLEAEQPLNPTKSLPDQDQNLLLFTEEQDAKRPTTASFLSRFADLNSLPPMDPDSVNAQMSTKKGADLGTLTGVFLPCIQNIFGVILFIRMVWIVGTAGVPLAFLVVLICCMVTFTTCISLSAIATNGIVPAGGSYFMISRALGPEFGGAVGLLFFLGTSVAAAMYITGAVEIILNYMAPEMGLFGDFRASTTILYHNIRVYGTCFVLICGLLVFIGVKFVSKIAPVALLCVILSILSIYGGVFVNYEGTDDVFCSLGDRIMAVSVEHCTKNQTDPESLFHRFCSRSSNTSSFICDDYYDSHDPIIRKAVPGIASGVLHENIEPRFRTKGDLIDYGDGEYDANKPRYANILVDITTSFTMFVAIYFPSCTGILAGSNRSGDLKDGQKSIPTGTLAAQLVTSFVYLSSVVLFGAAFNNLFIRDKFGECMGGQLAVTLVAWPYPFLIVVGSLFSTLGAALQSLTSAPRLLQAIAQDNIIPFLNCFAHIDSRGEPVRALGITLVIAEIAVLIGNLDFIAPILTMFFLMCYMFVNLACTLQSLLRTPNWRPRFKFYHWSFSLMGVGLCLFVMFISAWHFALMAMFIAGCIYKYIEYRGAEKEWGDGFRGLALSAARFSLLRLEDGPPHTKNWRPQILVFVSLNEANLDATKDRKILTFASQLKAGKGLTLVASVLEGDLKTRHHEVQAAKNSLKKVMHTEKVKGFTDVIISPSLSDGLCYFIQIAGLAGLKPNTVILGWPRGWRSGRNGPRKTKMFMDTIRTVTACRQHALLVPKGCETWPDSGDKMGGTIDIWWIVLDGGLLMLIPFLLRQHRTWKNTKLRIFTVAQLEDNSIQMKKDLAAWVYALRIDAEVEVVELQETDLSGYAYERTLRMEQRSEIMKHLDRETTGIPGDVTPAYGSGTALLYSGARSGRRESKTALAIEQLLRETKGIKEAREALEPDKVPTAKKEGGPTVKFSGSTKRKSSKGSESEGVASINESKDGEDDSGQNEEETPLQSKLPIATIDVQEPTPAPSPAREIKATPTVFAANLLALKPDETNVRRMHTAVKLNEVIVAKSHASKLVVLNLPGLPKHMTQENENHYMEFVEALTEGLDRVLLIRGAGREVITIYS